MTRTRFTVSCIIRATDGVDIIPTPAYAEDNDRYGQEREADIAHAGAHADADAGKIVIGEFRKHNRHTLGNAFGLVTQTYQVFL